MNLAYDVTKAISTAKFTIKDTRAIYLKTYCNVPDDERCYKCPVELSLSHTVSMPFTINSNGDGIRELKINATGAAYMLNVIRGKCAECKYNSLNNVKQR